VLLEPQTLQALALVALGLAVAALLVAVWTFLSHRRARRAPRREAAPSPAPLSEEQDGTDPVVATAGAVRHVAVVRYDAFDDAGGRLSFSAALLDAEGNGLVLTSIHGRGESRSYAKELDSGRSPQTLSPEEQEAISAALGRAS
jgi:hypothetical protein